MIYVEISRGNNKSLKQLTTVLEYCLLTGERIYIMHNDSLFEFVKKKFEKEGGCGGCNSRYCDGSFEWMSACQKFKEYFEKTTHPENLKNS